MRAAALALCVLLGACAGTVRVGVPVDAAELADTPFFPQAVNECGPAALATVLAAGGIATTPEALAPILYLPGRGGTLQAEIVAAARRHGRVPYPVAPTLDALLNTVAAGTPVLVLQNLGLAAAPRWHYAVVIGFDTRDDTLVLRSGTERRLVMSAAAFDRSWRLAQRWALAVVAPEAPPAGSDAATWLRAASAFEELGQPEPAARAYLAATQRWPGTPLTWQVLANLRYAQRDLAGAEDALRQAHRRAPAAVTLNNLALVLLERGCPATAREAVERAAGLPATDAERETIARTRAQVESHRGAQGAACAPL